MIHQFIKLIRWRGFSPFVVQFLNCNSMCHIIHIFSKLYKNKYVLEFFKSIITCNEDNFKVLWCKSYYLSVICSKRKSHPSAISEWNALWWYLILCTCLCMIRSRRYSPQLLLTNLGIFSLIGSENPFCLSIRDARKMRFSMVEKCREGGCRAFYWLFGYKIIFLLYLFFTNLKCYLPTTP